jgi:hypothetical protein
MEISTLDKGRVQLLTLPASAQGVATLKARLRALSQPIRLAISGSAALGLALALSQMPLSDVYIVAASVADQPVALARYAGRAI